MIEHNLDRYRPIYPAMLLFAVIFACVWVGFKGVPPYSNLFVVFIGTLVIALAATLFYFIPSFAAANVQHKNLTAIVLLNFLLGWTFIGWAIALIWAVKKE